MSCVQLKVNTVITGESNGKIRIKIPVSHAASAVFCVQAHTVYKVHFYIMSHDAVFEKMCATNQKQLKVTFFCVVFIRL
jgi:hypothetical protein